MKKFILAKQLLASIFLCFIFLSASIVANATNYYVSPTGSNATGDGTIGNPWLTIQFAINNNIVVNGDVINVTAGTYIENIIVNKELTLTGAGESLTFIKPAISNPNCGGSGGGSLCGGESDVFLVQANNVTIENLTVDGDNPNLKTGFNVGGANIDARNGIITNHHAGIYNNLNVNNVTIKNIYLRGIYASTMGSFNFNNNTVTNVQADPASIAIFNFGGSGLFTNNTVSNANDAISSNWSRGSTYIGNSVTNSGSGIHTDNNGGFGGTADLIQNNKVTNSTSGGYGIFVFAPFVSPTVNGNTITNVDVSLANFGQNAPGANPMFTNNTIDGHNKKNSLGVYQTTDQLGFGTNNVSGIYTNNFIQNTNTAFHLEYQAGNTNKISANNNSVTNNTNDVTDGTGINAAGVLVNDFSCNWWGTVVNSQIASKVSTGTNYDPYLTNGNDNSSAQGFQPVPGSCNSDKVVPCKKGKDDGVLICHNGETMCVGENALQAHLNHGDNLGACTYAPCSSENDFSKAVVLSSTQSAGKWYTDRYAPASFTSPYSFGGNSRLKESIAVADGQTNRPPAYNTSFYNTQGRAYDVTNGTRYLQIDSYVPLAWKTSGKRMAGMWGTAFDAANTISAYPVVEFTSDGGVPRFRGWETGALTPTWIDMGLPAGFTYNTWVTLSIELLSSGEFRYRVNNLQATTTTSAPDASVRIGNTILQGHNTTTGVNYDIYWDNFAFRCYKDGGDKDDKDDKDEHDRLITVTENTNVSINPKTTLDLSVPAEYRLSNYPNPFNNVTTVKYDVPVDSRVSLKVYNLAGQAIATLVDANKKAGTYTVKFNANNFAQGTYYCKLAAVAANGSQQSVKTQPMNIVK